MMKSEEEIAALIGSDELRDLIGSVRPGCDFREAEGREDCSVRARLPRSPQLLPQRGPADDQRLGARGRSRRQREAAGMSAPTVRVVQICRFCRRVEARCTCEGAYEPESVELSTGQQLSRGGTVQRRSVAAGARRGKRQPNRKVIEQPIPVVTEEIWIHSAKQALESATPENLAGPHKQVDGVWFTYLQGTGWVFTTDT
jgi:hypothetical protein